MLAIDGDSFNLINTHLNPIHLVLRNMLQSENYKAVISLAEMHMESDPVCQYFYYAARLKVLE